MVSKDPSSRGTPSRPTRSEDTSVAPYLTHIITHHGQVTLVPPQNQGRLRKNKRSHGVRAVRTEHAAAEGPSTASRPTSSSRSPTCRSKEKTSQCYLHPSSDPSRTTLPEPQRSISLDHPSPSYAFLRSEVAAPPGNDVISLCSSTSSDDFEDLIELDLESQWELDRMIGLTLEERVHREWNRREAARDAMPHSPVSVHSGTHSSPPLPSNDLPANEMGMQESAVSLPSDQGNPLKSIPAVQSRLLKPDPPRLPSKQRYPEGEKEYSRTFSEDGHTLKPVKKDPSPLTPSNSDHLVSTSGNVSTSGFRRICGESTKESIIHPAISTSNEISSAMGEYRDGLSRSPTEKTANLNMVSQSTDFRNVSFKSRSSRPLSYKGKEREMVLPDHNINFAAIHNRPLPIPYSPPESRHPAIRPLSTPSSLEYPSWSLAFQAKRASRTVDIPSEPPIRSVFPLLTSPSDVSVHYSAMGVGSVHDRPVLPPPPGPDFAQARRKPLPVPAPPSSYRLRASGSRGDIVCVNRSLRSVTGPESTGFEFKASPSGITPPPTSHSSSECREQDFRDGDDVSRSAPMVTDQGGCDSAAHAHGLVCESDTIIERRNSTAQEIALFTLPVTEEVSIPARVTEIFRDASLDDPSVVNSPPDPRPSSDGGLSQYTDLDILLSRLDDSSRGTRHEVNVFPEVHLVSYPPPFLQDLLIVGELFGPAQPQHGPGITKDLPLGKIEVVRRRKLQDGRVKLKLSLLGVVVDRCGVCLSQFKDAEWAVLLPCLHPFHSTCLSSWLVRSHTCPLCRGNLDTL